MTARDYIDHLMIWVENQLDNQKLFPSNPGIDFALEYMIDGLDIPFSDNFHAMVKVIFKRLFRVYAHIYHSHFQEIYKMGLEYHLNTSCRHFISFIEEYKLVDANDLKPLAELIQEFKSRRRVPTGK